MNTHYLPLRDWQAKALAEDRLSRVLVRMRKQPVLSRDNNHRASVNGLACGWPGDSYSEAIFAVLKHPYQPGDRLGLKETWGQGWFQCPGDELCEGRIRYRSSEPEWKRGIWRSPVTMPGDSGHVRFFRLVKSVRPCLVKDVTESEAKECGIVLNERELPDGKSVLTHRTEMKLQWTHDHPKHSFETTWVWNVELQKED